MADQTFILRMNGRVTAEECGNLIKADPAASEAVQSLTEDELEQHAYNRIAKRFDTAHATDARIVSFGALVSDAEPGTVRLVTVTSKGFWIVHPPRKIGGNA
ncbi:hypothetical protein G3N95_36130 [Paraburkholderia sp. Tr-20389]|uniref:hypothetical protein n=1 Tax=Paraburkholderia sp. Tr-20389 TaxID=2703903 RepID=UPI00197E90B2|nr:hypothetical protein [Paraburkholderia sp. Tr-20389]MBN3758385.1 hypothetical protein [Paraburkholderia sp. Tr-20389]